MTWQLHPQLFADCHELMVYRDIHVLLKKQKIIPWLILVPETTQRNLCDLDAEIFSQVLGLTKKISIYMQQKFAADKINVAEIGNVVPQLHVHVVARKKDDACWPGVVWGQTLDAEDYSAQQVAMFRQEILSLLQEFK